MSEILQPGQHPDADQLNAFIEHALPLHERQQTLAHLAACADCRAVVYLAEPSSPNESLQPQPIATPEPWFSGRKPSSWSIFTGWNLAWPASAALACLIILTVHLRNTGIARRQPTSITTAYLNAISPTLPAGSPPAQTPPPRPASARVQKPPAIAARSLGVLGAVTAVNAINADGVPPRQGPNAALESRGFAAPSRIPKPDLPAELAAAAGRQAIHGAASGGSLRPASQAPIAGSLAGPLGADTALVAGAGGSEAIHRQSSAAGPVSARQGSLFGTPALHSLSQQYQAPLPPPAASPRAAAPSSAATATGAFSGGVLPPPPAASASAAPASANQTVTLADAASIEPQNSAASTIVAGAAMDTLESKKSLMLREQPILPSRLPALSAVANLQHKLAIDTAGALFRSEDAGVTWRPVPAQWTGRAVRVALTPPKPQTAAKAASSVTATAAAKPAATTLAFELTTDTGDLWISADGQTWKRK